MWIWLEPLDVLMFRDSRPFAGGETHRARSIFPPSPLTVQGALRTKLLAQALAQKGLTIEDFARYLRTKDRNNADLDEIIGVLGDADQFGAFRMTGPLVAKKGGKSGGVELFFPVPYDLLGIKSDGVASLSPLAEGSYAKMAWDSGWKEGLRPLWWRAEEERVETEELPGTWLDLSSLKAYLEGRIEGIKVTQASEIYAREQRAGIKLQRATRTVEVGMLYVAEFIRLKEYHGCIVEVNLDHAPLNEEKANYLKPMEGEGILQLGGEARACWYHPLSGDPLSGLREHFPLQDNDRCFKLYLASPAVFQQGWLPDFLNNDLEGALEGVKVKLVAATVGKPIPIGHWDLAHNRPKKLFHAIPPGSVYFFELLEDSSPNAVRIFHGTTHLQMGRKPLGNVRDQDGKRAKWLEELAKIGFGLTLVGRWEYCKLKEVR